jgi:hypothetical protein
MRTVGHVRKASGLSTPAPNLTVIVGEAEDVLTVDVSFR